MTNKAPEPLADDNHTSAPPPIKTPEEVAVETEEQVAKTEERSRELRRQRAEGIFQELYWPLERVLIWIAFRDPDRLEGDFLSKMGAATMYSGKLAASLVDPDARTSLLLALQADDIRAIRDGRKMLPDMWATATGRSLPAVLGRQLRAARILVPSHYSVSLRVGESSGTPHTPTAPPKFRTATEVEEIARL